MALQNDSLSAYIPLSIASMPEEKYTEVVLLLLAVPPTLPLAGRGVV
jgi:hypothetical protein